MKPGLIAVCALFLLAIPSPARPQNTSQSAQDKTSVDKSDKAQIVGTAEITKIDAKKQMLTVKNIQSTSTGNPNESGAGSARRPGGGGGGGGFPGGGGRRRGGGYPGGGGRPPSGGGQSQSSQPKEYKVYVTKETVIKLANADLDFGDLHVGDRIAVAGTPKNGSGGDLQATTITRDPQ